jgi:carbon monoxide dehydrogenase subunit G
MTMQLPAHPSEWFGYPADRTEGRRLAPRREGARIFHHREREVPIGYIDASQHLSASPAAVWRVLTDPRTWDRWFAVHDSWVTPPPSGLAAGTRLSATLSMLGVTNTLDWTVESVEDGSRIELAATGAGGLSVRLMFRLSPAGSGSWITASGQFSGAMLSPALLDAVEAEGVAKLVESLAGLDMRAREAQAREISARPQLRVVR